MNLEEFKLLIGLGRFFLLFTNKQLNVTKLLISDTKYAYIAIFGQDRLHTLDMHQSVFHAWTVTQIDGKLKHGEAITHDMLSEKGSVLALLDGLSRQVVEH